MSLRKLLGEFRQSIREVRLRRGDPTTAATFSRIYEANAWRDKESRSGFGSRASMATQARMGIERLLEDLGARSLLDAPCGDFNWMRDLNFGGQYVGADIVPDLIAHNERSYSNATRSFICRDIARDSLPKSDVVLCRDCLNHLPLHQGLAAIQNLKAASKLAMVISHHPEVEVNRDQTASFRYRPLNLALPPFSLPEPDLTVPEAWGDGRVLGVWLVPSSPRSPLRPQTDEP